MLLLLQLPTFLHFMFILRFRKRRQRVGCLRSIFLLLLLVLVLLILLPLPLLLRQLQCILCIPRLAALAVAAIRRHCVLGHALLQFPRS